MSYAMVFASVGALLLAVPALAASPHSHGSAAATMTIHDQGRAGDDQGGGDHSRGDRDRDRDEMAGLLDGEMRGIFHNPHCDPDDRDGPDGDRDDKAAHNPGRGRHVGRCIGHPASP